MRNKHVLVIPYPAQGHVMTLMEVARCLTSDGLKVTFVNMEFIHKQVMSAWTDEQDGPSDLMQMVCITDEMEPRDDMKDPRKLPEAMPIFGPNKLEELLEGINKADDDKITCIIADYCMGWVIRVAKKMGIRQATYYPGSAANLALALSLQKLMDDEVIDSKGVPLKKKMVQPSPTMPSMDDPAHFPWLYMGDPVRNQVIFDVLILEGKKAAEASDYIICNSHMELEPGAFSLFPKVLPIRPLLSTTRSAKQAGHFWKADTTCQNWLDQQQVCSVIYVAFGSVTIFDQNQFEELALGLELTNKPFLWAVRPDTPYVYPSGYMDRISSHGKVVSWAPQQEILNHPSVACFVSHCGWNSTIEGVSNGVPFLCWPYTGDHFSNTTYVRDIWKIGLGLDKDETGVVTRGEIKSKVEQLLSNKTVKENALNLQEKLQAGNSSYNNIRKFIDWIKEGGDNLPANEEAQISCLSFN
ncbi:hypothetical protein L1987_44009 [Smallanthus sonchifolius]|uniref:Uncharacterized protein n=1 Tax=Smallanthus sonchifolius TaxID=185202 RepID=A0ACB9GPG6_9ASTR|nr:hypothetical protein L1987_44009 [Smallanthus sonchifolius]